MNNLINVFAEDDNQVNKEIKPPPRVCPRCNSDNTKFCYYNNYNVSQPRYFCKNCRRHWTHGGALRNIPIGGSGRKPKRPKVNHQSSTSSVVSVENQPVNHQQPSRNVQENNEFVGSFGGSSSAAAVIGNLFRSLSDIPDGVPNVTPVLSFRLMDRLDVPDESFQQDYFDVGSNDLIGNPLINQSIGGYVDNHNGYRVNHVDQPEWNQSFMTNNTMNVNHMANASGSRESENMNNNNNNNIRNNCLFRSTRHLENHDP